MLNVHERKRQLEKQDGVRAYGNRPPLPVCRPAARCMHASKKANTYYLTERNEGGEETRGERLPRPPLESQSICLSVHPSV
mmetsp:Transcript_5343/g.10575  ORF Transcript_5343/g.10575 Transcript_5343/m.10575 type:complete len:81 (+) Transcript_5343:443-685(+)